ncbi:acyl-coenzyme A diphosphatase Fitm [Haemaphysalis longicornis]
MKMAGNQRRSRTSSALKWDANAAKQATTGRKPLAEPMSVTQVLVMVGLHVCRRVLVVEPRVKVPVYLGVLLVGSVMCDFFPIPRSYFSRKDNVFNVYFVKLAWGWTFTVVGLFVGVSSWVYCCADRAAVRRHLSRLLVGTVAWFVTTNFFVRFESYAGRCTVDKYGTQAACVKAGQRWISFDISGHAFLLIFCNLLIAEEARSFCGWERIGDLLRNEKYDEESPLKELSAERLRLLQDWYPRLTAYVRLLFVAMTCLSLIWDLMLVCTVLYFHSMAQKMCGGAIAILEWYVIYRVWYALPWSPGLPGKGPFKYADVQKKKAAGPPRN